MMPRKSRSSKQTKIGKKGGKAKREFYTHIGNVKRSTRIRKGK